MIPVALLVTCPGPVWVTESMYEGEGAAGGEAAVKVAPTVTGALPVNVHGAVPVHPPPLQPPNVEPLTAVADTVTTVPLEYVSTQSVPQLIPVGLLVTVPWPVPPTLTVTARPLAVPPQASFEYGDDPASSYAWTR